MHAVSARVPPSLEHARQYIFLVEATTLARACPGRLRNELARGMTITALKLCHELSCPAWRGGSFHYTDCSGSVYKRSTYYVNSVHAVHTRERERAGAMWKSAK